MAMLPCDPFQPQSILPEQLIHQMPNSAQLPLRVWWTMPIMAGSTTPSSMSSSTVLRFELVAGLGVLCRILAESWSRQRDEHKAADLLKTISEGLLSLRMNDVSNLCFLRWAHASGLQIYTFAKAGIQGGLQLIFLLPNSPQLFIDLSNLFLNPRGIGR